MISPGPIIYYRRASIFTESLTSIGKSIVYGASFNIVTNRIHIGFTKYAEYVILLNGKKTLADKNLLTIPPYPVEHAMMIQTVPTPQAVRASAA